MINEENIVNEYLALGKLDLALEEAKKNGFNELAKKIESSLLKDKNSYLKHYEQNNNRVPGAQVTAGWGLDGRQSCALSHIVELSADSLLDIGCADGSFIFNCLHKNVIKQGVGVDAWKEGIAWAKQFGTTNFSSRSLFFQGLFEEHSDYLLTSLFPFKAIHIGEVLEHVLDPINILAKAKTLLRSDGGIVVTVPVKRPPLTQHEKAILTSGDVNEHMRYIDLDTLEKYADTCGLKIIKKQYDGNHWVNLIATLGLG